MDHLTLVKRLAEISWRLRFETSRRLYFETWERLAETWERLAEPRIVNPRRTRIHGFWPDMERRYESRKKTKQSRKKTKQSRKKTKQSRKITKQLEENQKRLEGSTRQFKENKKLLEESTWQLQENEKGLEENQKRLDENQKRIEENQKRLEGSKKREGTRRLVKPHQGLIAPKYKPRPQLTSWILSRALIMMQLVGLFCGATGNTDCLTTQSVLLGSQGIIRCRLFENSTRFYWFDTNNEGGDTLLIKLENGRVSGTGYTTGKFNIDSDGSLIINSVTVQHERVFHLESVNSNLFTSTKDITVIVYVEPIEPIPVITKCLGKSDCIMKGNLDGVISCVHHNTRPAAKITWFIRDGTHDIPLNSTTNQTLSADLITFSVTSEMAIGEIPFLIDMQSLVLLVCKSHNPYSVVQESNSKVLLDLSQNDPFEKQSDLPEDPVYAIQNQDLVIECPLHIAAEDSIVVWMAKSLETRNSVYLKYSAYRVVPSVETDEQLSLDKSGDLVISQVGLHHDGLYACVQSTGNTTKSFLQRVEVIVQPTPPKLLVEGCNLFEPCSFHITETKAITCKVNGVHPEVELMIIVMSTNLAVMNTKVSTYEDEGLFYTSIHGDVILVDANCQVNGTILCQAVGPAANVFKSDATISISSNGVKCHQISAAPFPDDKEVQVNLWIIICLTISVTLLCVFSALIVIRKYFAKVISHRHMQAVPVTELNSVFKDRLVYIPTT
ncbi:uncharacterized protein [Apostichopus japonicus]|uniref:uncharacterized protein isoform X2 n=1 Tax=Stichopus japonicus TaxID=307972 RepID=UPI003AB1BAD4